LLLLSNLDDLIFPCTKKEQTKIVTIKKITNLSLLLKAIEFAKNPKLIFLSTYNISKKALLFFKELCEEYPALVFKIIVAYSIAFRNKEVYSILQKMPENFEVVGCYNHSKIIGVQSNTQNIVIEGSGNFSYNTNIEQYTIDNDLELFNFHLKWIKEIKKDVHKYQGHFRYGQS